MTEDIVVRDYHGFRIAVARHKRGYVARVTKLSKAAATDPDVTPLVSFGPHRTCEHVLDATMSAIDIGFVH